MEHSNIEEAYLVGRELARKEFEKTAFLGALFRGGKFLAGMGHLGRAGSRLSRISGHHVGMPLGFGLLNAATAEDGEKSKAFVKGLAGGLAFNALMPLGASIGKRLFAPGFSGKGSLDMMRRIGFGKTPSKLMAQSQGINRALRSRQGLFGRRGVLERMMESGNFSKSKDLFSALNKINKKNMPPEMRTQLARLKRIASGKTVIDPSKQKAVLNEFKDFSKKLYQTGFTQGTAAQQRALKGLRFSKGLGIAAGGMGLGMVGSHALENTMNTTPASYFNSTGGH